MGTADKTCFKSICRETYQKHPPVTISFAAKIASFSIPPPRGRLVVSRSLATLMPIQTCFDPNIPDGAMTCPALSGKRPGHVNGRGGAKFKRGIAEVWGSPRRTHRRRPSKASRQARVITQLTACAIANDGIAFWRREASDESRCRKQAPAWSRSTTRRAASPAET